MLRSLKTPMRWTFFNSIGRGKPALYRLRFMRQWRILHTESSLGWGGQEMRVFAELEWMRAHPAYFNPSVAELGFAQLGIEQASDIPKWGGLVCCHAQEAVIGAWAKCGFVVDEGMGKWVEEGIWHVGMFQRLDLSSAGQK